MDSDYLANNHNWGTYFSACMKTRQGCDHLLILTNLANGSVDWRRDWYSELNLLGTQGIVTRSLPDTQGITGYSCERSKRWLNLLDTQGIIGEAIDRDHASGSAGLLGEAILNRQGRDWYLILNNSLASGSAGQSDSILKELSETWLIFHTQQACERNKRWSDLPDTQGIIGEAINTGRTHLIRTRELN